METEIEVPEGINFEILDMKIIVEGTKEKLEKDFDDPRFNEYITLEKRDNKIVVRYDSERRKIRSMANTIVAHVKNMIKGITVGYKYTMKVIYTHFPITVSVEKGEVHVKNFLGEKGSRTAKIVRNAQVHIDKDLISITGPDIEAVSQTAANIEQACKLTKRDRRIFQDGIYTVERQSVK